MNEALHDIERLSRELSDRQDVVVPKGAADTLDVFYDRTYGAVHYIYALNALLEVISARINQGPDGPLISLLDICQEQLTEIKRAFYGEPLGP